MTTLAERRIPGELIETFKAVNELSSLDTNFDISGSGLNLVARSVNNGTAKVKLRHRNFYQSVLFKFTINCHMILGRLPQFKILK